MKLLKGILSALLVAAMILGGVHMMKVQADTRAEAEIRAQVMAYKPRVSAGQSPADPGQGSGAAKDTPNESILELRRQNPDIVGWLTVPHTGIDYPFARADDNKKYLRRGLDGKSATAGTIFMDYRSAEDFTDFQTILYGHNMKSGTMFGTLKQFGQNGFLNERHDALLFLPERTLRLELFAFLVIRADDAVIYGNVGAAGTDPAGYLAYVRRSAQQYRDIALRPEDRIVALSTCSYEFDNARMVLLGRIQR